MLLFLARLGSASTTPSPPRPLGPPCTMEIYDLAGRLVYARRLVCALAGEAGEELGLQGAEGFKGLTARGTGCVVLACFLLVALRLLYRLYSCGAFHAEQPAQRGLLVLAPPPPGPTPPVSPPPSMPLRPPSLPPTPPSLPPQLDRPEDEEVLLAQELHAQELAAGLASDAAEAAEAESLSQQLLEAALHEQLSAAVAMALHEHEMAAAVSAAVELQQATKLHELQQAQVRHAAEEAASEALVLELQQYSRQAHVRRAAEEAASDDSDGVESEDPNSGDDAVPPRTSSAADSDSSDSDSSDDEAAKPAAKPANGGMEDGTCVRLHSLRQRDDLNGMAGVILGSQGERYGVRVAGSTLAVKAANLTLVPREECVAQETVLEGEVYLGILAGLLLPTCASFAATCKAAWTAAEREAAARLTPRFGDLCAFGPPLATLRYLHDLDDGSGVDRSSPIDMAVYSAGKAWISSSVELCHRGEHALVHHTITYDRGIAFTDAVLMLAREVARCSAMQRRSLGFYRSTSDILGRPGVRGYVLLLTDNHVGACAGCGYRAFRPSSGMGKATSLDDFLSENETLRPHMERIDEAEAEAGWTWMYEDLVDKCMHGQRPHDEAAARAWPHAGKCRPGCEVGKRILHGHMLGGAFMRFWPTFAQVANEMCFANDDNTNREEDGEDGDQLWFFGGSTFRRPRLVMLPGADGRGHKLAGVRVSEKELVRVRLLLGPCSCSGLQVDMDALSRYFAAASLA